MSNLGKRTLIFIIVLIAACLILFSYFFSGSRADRLTSDDEYIKSLQEASRGKQLAGQQPLPTVSPTKEETSHDPSNLWEEIIFQLKAVFTVR